MEEPQLLLDADHIMSIESALEFYKKNLLKKKSKYDNELRVKEVDRSLKEIRKYRDAIMDWISNIPKHKLLDVEKVRKELLSIASHEWRNQDRMNPKKQNGGLRTLLINYVRNCIGEENIVEENLEYPLSNCWNGTPYYMFCLKSGHILTYSEWETTKDKMPEVVVSYGTEWKSTFDYYSNDNDNGFGWEQDMPNYKERCITMKEIVNDTEDFVGYLQNKVLKP